MAQIRTWSTDRFDLVTVSGALDLAAVEKLAGMLRSALSQPGHDVLLDLSGVRMLDSIAAGHLRRLAADAEQVGSHLLVIGVHGVPRPDSLHGWGIQRLLATLTHLPTHSIARRNLRNHLITTLLPLAAQVARRFQGTGEPAEDLEQVAVVALINSIDRFDPDRGDFFSYAVTTINGELKRHLRDLSWDVRPPRRLLELSLVIHQTEAELGQVMCQSPRTADLAAHLDLPEQVVIDARGALHSRRSVSLHSPSPFADATLMDTLGAEDARLDDIDSWVALRPAIAALPARTRRILQLRYGCDMTQSEIAQEMGLSQMHVSRILADALHRLREELLGWGEPPPAQTVTRAGRLVH